MCVVSYYQKQTYDSGRGRVRGGKICLFWLLAILNVCQMLFVVIVVVGFAVIVTPNSEM